MIDVKDFPPFENETMEQYKFRLFTLKSKTKSVTWEDVRSCILHHYGVNQTADFIRHEFYGVRKSMEIDNVNVGTRILCISDAHVPFNLNVDKLKDYRGQVDVLVFSGDILDCQSLSKFSKTYRVPLMEEMIKAREFMIDVIEYINPKQVKINYGNHELRFINYLAKKLDADMLDLMPETALDLICEQGFKHYDHRLRTKVFYEPLTEVFKDTGVEVEYTHSWWCKVGKTIFCHPSAFSSGILSTSFKAMQYFLQERIDHDSLCMAHTHQVGYHYCGKIHLYEQGCFCDSSEMTYSDGKLYKSQTNGIVFIVQDKTGNLIYDKSKLVLL